NLIAANFPERDARSMAALFDYATRERSITPLYPEAVLGAVSQGNMKFSLDMVAQMTELIASPNQSIQQSCEALARIWEELRPLPSIYPSRPRKANQAASQSMEQVPPVPQEHEVPGQGGERVGAGQVPGSASPLSMPATPMPA